MLASGEPHNIQFTYSTPHDPVARRTIIRTIELIGGQPRLKRLYDRYVESTAPDRDFFQSAIDLLGLRIGLEASALGAVPRRSASRPWTIFIRWSHSSMVCCRGESGSICRKEEPLPTNIIEGPIRRNHVRLSKGGLITIATAMVSYGP